MIKAYELQNKQNYEDSVICLEKIYKNFHMLGSIVDQIPITPLIIKENREILSSAHTDKLNERFPNKMNNQYEYDKRDTKLNGKKKQKKTKWGQDEQEKFLEGLELHGVKNIKKITEHVKSRTIHQVRSHLQKHQMKVTKLNLISKLNGKDDTNLNLDSNSSN